MSATAISGRHTAPAIAPLLLEGELAEAAEAAVLAPLVTRRKSRENN
jgi:hypothetical protein